MDTYGGAVAGSADPRPFPEVEVAPIERPTEEHLRVFEVEHDFDPNVGERGDQPVGDPGPQIGVARGREDDGRRLIHAVPAQGGTQSRQELAGLLRVVLVLIPCPD